VRLPGVQVRTSSGGTAQDMALSFAMSFTSARGAASCGQRAARRLGYSSPLSRFTCCPAPGVRKKVAFQFDVAQDTADELAAEMVSPPSAT
jgi:hypothetical protein